MVACDESEAPAPASLAPPEAIPASVAIPASEVELGAAISTIRKTVELSAFRITRFPVTVGDYRQCVVEGRCSTPELSSGACSSERVGGGRGPTYEENAPEDVPVTCVSPSQAAAYCAWVGGRLPTVAELSLAARGPKVKRHPWGDDPVSCDKSWRVVFSPDLPGACCGAACSDLSARAVGKHPDGASLLGLEDVLSTGAELALPQRSVVVGACGVGSKACYVAGMEPGALDWFRGVSQGEDRPAAFAAGFRCVFEEESR